MLALDGEAITGLMTVGILERIEALVLATTGQKLARSTMLRRRNK
jgi:hypothetical protein